jgi:uncharacterized protein (DUF169 family)
MASEPLAFFWSDEEPAGHRPEEGQWACVVALLGRARRGETVYFDAEHFGCGGAGYYLGFCEASPTVDYFVSTGIPGQMEGEHYKRSPELVRAARALYPPPLSGGCFGVVKRFSALAEGEVPEVVICFPTPDELAGLAMLAGYARSDDAVICPWASGCGSLITRPLLEGQSTEPRAAVGLFDPSSRIFMREHEMSFAAPRVLWEEMLGNAEESFLKTETWAKLRRRIAKPGG